jgi:predicted ribosomally synthesized peptide with SipW-like signal peptide
MQRKTIFKIGALLLALALMVASLGGISAYFTDADSATNTFEIGEVDIELQEPNWPGTPDTTPNETTPKDPQIYNKGKSDAFVFLEVLVPYRDNIVIADQNGIANAPVTSELFVYETNPGWVEIQSEINEQDGVVRHLYAYIGDNTSDLKALPHGATTTTLFDEVTFINAVEGQGLENTTQDIVINAYGIQTNDINGNRTDPDGVWAVIANAKDIDNPTYIPTVDELIQNHKFEYYSSLALAVNDVNANTIGENADVNRPEAVAGVYVDDGAKHVVLLKNATESAIVEPSVDMTINLAGNTLTTAGQYGIRIVSGDVVIDGRQENSTIQSTNSTAVLFCKSGSSCVINDGTYTNQSNTHNVAIANSGDMVIKNATISSTHNGTGYAQAVQVAAGTIEISNCNINATSSAGYSYAVSANGGETIVDNCEIMATAPDGVGCGVSNYAKATVSNCNINASGGVRVHGASNTAAGTLVISDCDITATTLNGHSMGVYSKGVATVSDCNVIAYANYDGQNIFSHGINSAAGTLTVNNCYVMGTHSGVQTAGEFYINGGTYEGYGHGGLYCGSAGVTSYASNATFRHCEMPDGYTSTGTNNQAGCYIGGKERKNITVYMDNCDIYGEVQPIVLRGTEDEQNNTLYISNSTINTNYTSGIRIDNNTHKLYIGSGNNFTINDVFKGQDSVIETDDVYIKS